MIYIFCVLELRLNQPKEFWYDVVLQFFIDDELKSRNIALNNYYVKFFSNSPGFVYKYAYLYHQNDMLVEVLADKISERGSHQRTQ